MILVEFKQYMGLWFAMLFILVVVFFNIFNLWYGLTYKVLPKTEEYLWMFGASLALAIALSTLTVVVAARRPRKSKT